MFYLSVYRVDGKQLLISTFQAFVSPNTIFFLTTLLVRVVHFHLESIFPYKMTELPGHGQSQALLRPVVGTARPLIQSKRTVESGSSPNKSINNPVLLIFGITWK